MTALIDVVREAYADFDVARLRDAHWVMDLASLKQIRAELGLGDDDKPGPDATMFGLPIKVTDDGGQPRLVVD